MFSPLHSLRVQYDKYLMKYEGGGLLRSVFERWRDQMEIRYLEYRIGNVRVILVWVVGR